MKGPHVVGDPAKFVFHEDHRFEREIIIRSLRAQLTRLLLQLLVSFVDSLGKLRCLVLGKLGGQAGRASLIEEARK